MGQRVGLVERTAVRRRKKATPKAKKIPRSEVPPPIQVQRVIRCPSCGTDRLAGNGRRGRFRYYRCTVCCDSDSLYWTTFKVLIEDPLSKPIQVENPELGGSTGLREVD
jgi:transposase-like protein